MSPRGSRCAGTVGVAALAAGGAYGFTLAIIAGAETFLARQFDLSTRQLGWVVSNLDLGAAIGALLAGPLSDRYGRRRLLLATGALFLASAALTAAAPNVATLLLGRGLAGLAVGASMIMPLYVAEVSPAPQRGLLVSLVQIGIVSGILAAFYAGWLAADAGPGNWRVMFALGLVPATALLLAAVRLPESPRWLISRGARHDAFHVLTQWLGPQSARDELESIERTVSAESGTWRDLLRPGMRPALRVGLVLTLLSVTVGINAVILYGPLILIEGAGEQVTAALRGSVILGVVNFGFSLVAMVTIDRWGRKPLLLSGLVGMGLAMGMLASRFGVDTHDQSTGLLLPIVAFVACYAVSLGPIAWVLVAEIFPTKTRGVGMAVCIIVMYLADFVVTLAFPWMMDELGNGSFAVFATVCALGALFVWVSVPETKGQSLEQIERLWR